ncbi:MAG: Ldh family oxidoreductase, partial [Actinomycetota bacterium]|nr:Ldh family oxidoreductase [Actinomycetota bacterium]
MPVERFTVPDDIAIRVDQATMRAAVENIFEGVGMPRPDAEQAADTLLYADLRGIDSHGVSNMFPIYMHWFRD